MRNYNGFSYSPDYGFELYCDGDKIDSAEKVRAAACFSRVFHDFGGKNQTDFRGIYILRCRKNFVERSGNYCSLEMPYIVRIMRYMRNTFDMTISVKEDEENYVFNFEINGKPIKHKFILTFSRVFFEFPYNEWAKDALRLRDSGVVDGINYSNKSFLELFNLIHATYQDLWGSNHSLFYYPSIEVPSKIMREVFEKGCDRVHNVYKGTNETYDKMHRPKTDIRKLDWEGNFKSRVKYYSENFQILRQLKQDEKGIRRRARKELL